MPLGFKWRFGGYTYYCEINLRKMKKLRLLLALAFFGFYANAQTDTLTLIANSGCECVTKKDVSGSPTNIKMTLGLCLIEGAQPYSGFLKRKHDLDLVNMGNEEGRKMGQLIGLRMASICPEFFQQLSQSGALDEVDEAEKNMGAVYGTVTKIGQSPIVVFEVKDSDGKVWQLLWLDEFDGSSKYLYNYGKLKGEKVSFGYKTMQVFDARINEYITKYIITSINNIPPPPPEDID